MRRRLPVIVGLVLAVALAAAAPAHAVSDPGYANVPPGTVGGVVAGGGAVTVQAGPPPKGGSPRRHGHRRHPRAHHPRHGTVCHTIGKRRICSTYRHDRLTRVCVRRRHHKRHCHRPRHRQRHRHRRHASAASANRSEGFTNAIPPMGKVWGFDSLGQLQYTCSGTLVTVNIVLTAGHCLWDNENELIAGGGYIGSQYTILFTPGSAYAGDNGDQVASTTAPYGVYQAQYWGVPNCYVASTAWPQGNGHCDIGLMQVSPSGGHNPGEYTGTYPVVYGLTAYPNQTEFENAGYPASGTFFSSATGGYGDAPYYCDNIWDGRRLSNTDADTSNDEPLVGDGLDLTKSCGATGGASGGPVFTPYNGAWYIDGVNNIGDDPKFHPESNGFSYTNGHQIFDTAVSGPFLCNYICAGTASTASMRTATAASRPRLGRPPRFGAQAFAGIARSMGARGDGAPRDARPLYPHARPISMVKPQR